MLNKPQNTMPKGLNDEVRLSTPRPLPDSFVQQKNLVSDDLERAFMLSPTLAVLAIRPIKNRSRKIYLLTLFLSIFVLAVFFVGLSFAIQEPIEIQRCEMWIWFTVLLGYGIYTAAADRVTHYLKDDCFNQIDEGSLSNFRNWLLAWYSRKVRLIFSIAIGVTLLIALVVMTYSIVQRVTPLSYIAMFFVCQFIAGWVHGATMVPLFSRFLRQTKTEVLVYPVNPSRSILVIKTEDIIRVVGFAFAGIVALLIPMAPLLSGQNLNNMLLGFAIVIATEVIVSVVFVVANHDLSQVIQRRKNIVIDNVQEQIRRIIEHEDVGDKIVADRLDYLSRLHDSISESPNTTFSTSKVLRMFSSVLVPAISFSISNYQTLGTLAQTGYTLITGNPLQAAPIPPVP